MKQNPQRDVSSPCLRAVAAGLPPLGPAAYFIDGGTNADDD
jgi:hypothetical protein